MEILNILKKGPFDLASQKVCQEYLHIIEINV